MTYNLAELRALAEGEGETDTHIVIGGLPWETVLALAEVAEAAHEFEPQPDKWSNGDQRNRLRAALAKFSFNTKEVNT